MGGGDDVLEVVKICINRHAFGIAANLGGFPPCHSLARVLYGCAICAIRATRQEIQQWDR